MFRSAQMRAAARWLAIRIAALPLIFVIVSAASHFLLFGPLAEQAPAARIAGQGAPEAQLEAVRRDFNLDGPWIENYARWLADAVRGDFGREFLTDKPVAGQLQHRFAPTAQVLTMSFAIAGAIGVVLAYLASRGVWPERAAIVLGAGLASVPVFVTAILAIIYPLIWWHYSSPVDGYESPFNDPLVNLRITIPASVVVGLATSPFLAHTIRFGSNGGIKFRSLAVAFAAWFPIALSMLVITERVFSVRGEAEWIFIAAFVQDLLPLHALLTLATFIGISIRLFVPADKQDVTATATEQAYTVIRDPLLIFAAAVVFLVALTAVLGLVLSPYDGRALDVDARFVRPSWEHWFGTDKFGHDMFTRLAEGVRVALWFTLRASALSIMGAGAISIAASPLGLSHRRHIVGLLTKGLSIPPLWWIFAVLGVSRYSEWWLIGAIAFGGSIYISAALAGRIAAAPVLFRERTWSLVLPFAAAVAQTFAVVTLLYLTLEFIAGVVVGTPGAASLGDDFNRNISDGTEYRHLRWFPILTIALLLFPLNLIAQTLHAAEQRQVGVADASSDAAAST